MKKFIIAIMLVFCATGAHAANENAATSKEYVDAELATKQPTIPAEGANVVMTFDSTADDGIGTKNIYDPSGNYASQQEALVTAATANAAMQMAINGEFVCHEYSTIDPTDCWLWKIKEPVNPSRNLFDISKVPTRTVDNGMGTIIHNGDGSLTITNSPGNSAVSTNMHLSQLAPDLVAGNTYKLSFNTTGVRQYILLYCNGHTSDTTMWYTYNSKVITENLLDCTVLFYPETTSIPGTISNIQIEEGTVATPYQPYGQNTFLPQNVQ